ncbi:uncharacterized protein LOC141854971 [Brevipalpus obovatus]|uniref:uncharacterized protein LOC141854971 n=1 Tax=Brevipalpus obovatus TaxID=246614 RepID=UPI003D9EB3A7
MSGTLVRKKRGSETSSSALTDLFKKYDSQDESWINMDSLLQDNLMEVTSKFDKIDPEIWGKVSYFEKNQRLAKAYTRSGLSSNSVLNINGSKTGFDGFDMGLKAFATTNRKVQNIIGNLKEGIEIVMNDCGSLRIVNKSRVNIFAKSWNFEDSKSPHDTFLSTLKIVPGKSCTIFDMDTFLDKLDQEVRTPCPVRNKLERQTICIVAIGSDSIDMINIPCWLIIINLVALDILRAKMPSKFTRKIPKRRPIDKSLYGFIDVSPKSHSKSNSPGSTITSSSSMDEDASVMMRPYRNAHSSKSSAALRYIRSISLSSIFKEEKIPHYERHASLVFPSTNISSSTLNNESNESKESKESKELKEQGSCRSAPVIQFRSSPPLFASSMSLFPPSLNQRRASLSSLHLDQSFIPAPDYNTSDEQSTIPRLKAQPAIRRKISRPSSSIFASLPSTSFSSTSTSTLSPVNNHHFLLIPSQRSQSVNNLLNSNSHLY